VLKYLTRSPSAILSTDGRDQQSFKGICSSRCALDAICAFYLFLPSCWRLTLQNNRLVCHDKLKSQTHAILIRCMEAFKAQIPLPDLSGVISALIIVPQQTTGRLYLNFANELLRDFDLPHKAMRTFQRWPCSRCAHQFCPIPVLPGGGSDLVTEAERMATERVDILISVRSIEYLGCFYPTKFLLQTPRVFLNHVNGNPSLRIHLAKLRFFIFAEAHELTKTEVFLSFQLNAIKKRMPTRAKSPRSVW
jgi:hypothetical protein